MKQLLFPVVYSLLALLACKVYWTLGCGLFLIYLLFILLMNLLVISQMLSDYWKQYVVEPISLPDRYAYLAGFLLSSAFAFFSQLALDKGLLYIPMFACFVALLNLVNILFFLPRHYKKVHQFFIEKFGENYQETL